MGRRRSRRRKREQAPGWTWMLAGLLLGVPIGLMVYRMAATPPEPAALPASDASARETAPLEAAVDPAPPASPPAAVVEPPASRFDFYEILPQFEVVVPEVESAPLPQRRDREPVAVADPGSYVLQAGSFRSHADADRMQASLALLGIESRIQTVTIDQDVFHRVRVGPLSDLDELNRTRRQLRDADIEVLMMRVP